MSMCLNLKISLTCPRHRGYNPAKDGRSGIKAGCTYCERILEIYDKVASIETVVNGARETFKSVKADLDA
jgi:hypothetical protein